MIVKIALTVDINPETLECKILKQDATKPSVSKPSISREDDQDPEPKITLLDNKYILNNAAVKLLEVEPGDRVAIRYLDVSGINFPVIGKQEAYKISSGNKITKDFTVSCRGAGNDKLSEYGSIFNLSAMSGKDGLFVMIGDSDKPQQNTIKTDKIDTSKADEEEEIDLSSLEDLMQKDTPEEQDDDKQKDDTYEIDNTTLSI